MITQSTDVIDGVRVGVAIEDAWPHLEVKGTDPDPSLP